MSTKKSWLIFVLPLLIGVFTSSGEAIASEPEREVLEKRIDDLLERILKYRLEALERTRGGIVSDLDAWMDGDVDYDGTKVQLMITEAERVATEYGVDIVQLRRIHEVARKAILRADFIVLGKSGSTTLHEFTESMRDLPVAGNVVAHYGLIDEAEERAAESQRKRVVQYKNLIQVYIKALTTRDPDEALSGFENYAKLITDYVTEQERQVLDADMKAMLATQSAVAEFSSMLPLVGEAIDIFALASGESMDGEKLSAFDRSLTGLFLAGPLVIEQSIKRKAWAAVALAGLLETMKAATTDRVLTLNKRLGKAVGADKAVEAVIHKLELMLPPKIKAKAKVYIAKRQDAHRYADNFGNPAERDEAFFFGRKNAESRVEKFKTAVAAEDAKGIRKTMLRIQEDKHAMQLMTVENVGPDLIKIFNKEINSVYRQTDSLTKDHLADVYLESFAKAKGLDFAKMDVADKILLQGELYENIDVVLITNKSKKVKVSFDRDVTAKIKINGKKLDVPADVLDEAYGPALYKTINNKAPKDPQDVKQLMEKLDQVATDSLHNEAYTDLDVAIYKKGADAQFSDPDQIANVFAFKGNHWFEKAEAKSAKALEGGPMKQFHLAKAESDWEEGFRQLTKQFNSQIVERRKVMEKAFKERKQALQRGLKDASPADKKKIEDALKSYEKGLSRQVTTIPDDLLRAQKLMEKIGKTETPSSVMRKLANMGMTPQDVGQRMGQHVERMHRNFPVLRYDPDKKTAGTFDPKNLTQHMIWPDGWQRAKGSTLYK